jgi:hypothetical protein
MVSFHVPHLVAHISSLMRYAVTYGHAGCRALFGALFHLESPRDAFRVALRQSQFDVARQAGSSAKRKPPLLIHYHIFKNAGSSFEWALQQAYGRRFRQFDSSDPGGKISARQIALLAKTEPKLCAISSHQAQPPPPRILGRQVITSILIRDPIARIRSIYAFERSQQVDSPGARRAKELDFAGYVKWRLETSPGLFCNYQVGFCAGIANTAAGSSQADLETAIIRLDAIDLVGTVWRYAEWIALAQSVLVRHFGFVSLPVVHENRSAAQPVQSEAEIYSHLVQELGVTLADKLLEQNQMDMRLHQVADALLTRKLAEQAVAVRLGDTYAGLRGRTGTG